MKKILFLLLNVVIMNSLEAQDLKVLLYEKGKVPNYRPTDEKEMWDSADIVRISLVQEPELHVYLPAKANANGKAVMICPGGGYGILAWDWEGTDIARWLNGQGYAAFVLKYRLPNAKCNITPHLSPIGDAKRGMRIIRANAKKWNIDPSKIGVMGFSAGGHLASTLGTHFDSGNSSATDEIERTSSRPDFMILMYPVISMTKSIMHQGSRDNLIGKNPPAELANLYSNELQVTKETPPTILIHATDDTAVPVENSLLFFQALKDKGVNASMHVFASGGHGFSMAHGKEAGGWAGLVEEWLERR